MAKSKQVQPTHVKKTRGYRGPTARTRERGPSYPQKKPSGMFEAISETPAGKLIRSRHHEPELAQKRLDGVRMRHTDLRVVDHRPRNHLGELI